MKAVECLACVLVLRNLQLFWHDGGTCETVASSKFLGKAVFQRSMGLELPDALDVGKSWWTNCAPAFAFGLIFGHCFSLGPPSSTFSLTTN